MARRQPERRHGGELLQVLTTRRAVKIDQVDEPHSEGVDASRGTIHNPSPSDRDSRRAGPPAPKCGLLRRGWHAAGDFDGSR
jgi:hypothetical protein